MTDDPLPPASGTAGGDDELVSAVLDGEATEAEVDRVRSDPALAARLEQFRRASSMLADPPPPLPAEQRRAMLEESLAVGREPSDEPEAPVPAAPTSPLRPRRRVPPAFLVAAAVIVMMAVGLALMNGRGGQNNASRLSKQTSSDSSSKATGNPRANADSGARDKAGAVPGAPDPHPSGTQSAPTSAAGEGRPAPAYLGTFTGVDQLRTALGTLDPATLRPTGPPPGPPDPSVPYTPAQLQRCAQIPRGYEQQLGQPLAFAYAKVNGDSVVVISFPLADQPGRIREIALGQGCTVPIFGIER